MHITALYSLFTKSSGISTDTRSIKPGNIFFALKGDHFNANLFAQKALDAGAAYVVVDEVHFPADEKIIAVDNALKMLQELARYHRQQVPAKIIAISGSNGKTTTKELIGRVLETSYKTFSTKGNLNNHIGVPLSLLSIKEETEFAVIEMGANHIGETKLLCEITQPDFGLITNNGKDHLEGYGNIEGVRKGNGELFDFLRKENRTAFVCADQDDLMKMSEGIKRITYGENADANCCGKISEQFPFLKIEYNQQDRGRFKKPTRSEHSQSIQTQLIGKYNFENLMAAICIGSYFSVPGEKIISAIESYSPSNNRSQIVKRGTNTFILDAYNANPSSVNAALENFFALPEKNKIVILGDMAELGRASETEHRAVIGKLNEVKSRSSSGLKMAILIGEEFSKVRGEKDASFLHFKNVEQLKEWFSRQSFENYFFLLKASRVIGLEKLLS